MFQKMITPLIFNIRSKRRWIITFIQWTMSRIEPVTLTLEPELFTTEPLKQYRGKGKLDFITDSLFILLGCLLFFYFYSIASCHGEVWRVSLQVCLSPKLTKKAAALHFYSRKEHQLSREDLWILISQFFLGQTLPT